MRTEAVAVDIEQVWNPRPEGVDAPKEGYYSLERRGKVPLPVHIWFGPPEDDRAPRWQMRVGDRDVDPVDDEFDQVWPQCAKDPIPQEEYEYRRSRIAYAKDHGARSDPWARRSGKIDLLSAPIPE
jgi:hypothetical protein